MHVISKGTSRGRWWPSGHGKVRRDIITLVERPEALSSPHRSTGAGRHGVATGGSEIATGSGEHQACAPDPGRGVGESTDHSPVVVDDRVSTRATVVDPAEPLALEDALRASGHRVTAARRTVHAVLAAADDHLVPDEVVQRAEGDVNLATVYRVLALLEDLGLARSTRLGGDTGASWELAHPDDHVHLVCDRCDAVDHHVGDAVSHLRGHLLGGHGFAATEVDLVVRGTCARCRRIAGQVPDPSDWVAPADADDHDGSDRPGEDLVERLPGRRR